MRKECWTTCWNACRVAVPCNLPSMWLAGGGCCTSFLCVCVCACGVCVCGYMCVCVCVRVVCACVCMCACVCVCMCGWVCVCVCVYIASFPDPCYGTACNHTQGLETRPRSLVHVYVCLRVCMCVCIVNGFQQTNNVLLLFSFSAEPREEGGLSFPSKPKDQDLEYNPAPKHQKVDYLTTQVEEEELRQLTGPPNLTVSTVAHQGPENGNTVDRHKLKKFLHV